MPRHRSLLICCLNGNASAVNPDIQPPSLWPTRRRHAYGLVPDVPDHLRGVSTATKFRQNVKIILRIMTFCNKMVSGFGGGPCRSRGLAGTCGREAVRARRVPRTNTLDAHLPSTTPASAVPGPASGDRALWPRGSAPSFSKAARHQQCDGWQAAQSIFTKSP